ncbi:PP2C family protein-serine/threonine phosphatase [Streptomyces sp. PA03-5A]|nr:PP2C family protein-serine/threonine phosphatase [Streptomyces sp. PA03-5A]
MIPSLPLRNRPAPRSRGPGTRPAVGLLLLAAMSVLDGLCPPAVGWATTLVAASAAAAFAGASLTAGAVLIVAAAGIGLVVSPTGVPPVTTSQDAVVLVLSVVAVVFCVRQEHHQLELTAVRSVSEITQRVVLRPLPDRIGPLRVAAAYQASDAHATVGGDLYAAARVPGATRMLIGDVRGKGLQGIHEVAAAVGAFREAAPRCATLSEVAAHLECSMRTHLEEFEEGHDDAAERFVTALVLEIPDDRRVIRAVNCGHPAPLVSGGGRVTLLAPRRCGPPLGLGGLAPHDHHEDTFPFAPGDVLLLYTDGVTEARDPAGTFYPLQDRVASWAGDEPGGLVRHVREDLCRHLRGTLSDDVAIVALQRVPVPAQATAPGVAAGRVPGGPPPDAAGSSRPPPHRGDGGLHALTPAGPSHRAARSGVPSGGLRGRPGASSAAKVR